MIPPLFACNSVLKLSKCHASLTVWHQTRQVVAGRDCVETQGLGFPFGRKNHNKSSIQNPLFNMKNNTCTPNGWNTLERDLNRFVEDFFGGNFNTNPNFTKSNFHVPADVQETETHYTLHLDLPGLSKKDIQIAFKDKVLTISGTRAQTEKTEGASYFKSERSSGSFSRSFRLPKPIQVENITANFENGVLSIDIPKSEEVQPVQIEIK